MSRTWTTSTYGGGGGRSFDVNVIEGIRSIQLSGSSFVDSCTINGYVPYGAPMHPISFLINTTVQGMEVELGALQIN